MTAGNDRVLRVWDVCQLQGGAQGSEKALQELHGHASYVLSCDLSPTSLLISSVSLDSTLRLWHPTSPHPIFCATLPVAASCVRFVEGECTLLLTSGPGTSPSLLFPFSSSLFPIFLFVLSSFQFNLMS